MANVPVQEKREQVAAPIDDVPAIRSSLTDPSVRDKFIAEMAEKNKHVRPAKFKITNLNGGRRRVVYDYAGAPVTIMPNETKDVMLFPHVGEHLKSLKADKYQQPDIAVA